MNPLLVPFDGVPIAPDVVSAVEIEASLSEQTTPIESSATSAPDKTSAWIAQSILLAILLAASGLICVHSALVSDEDIWWHLRTGAWILTHHAVPRVDPYSAPLAGTSWLAYSWLFEVIVVKLFYRLGLAGIVVYTTAMVMAIAGALYHLVRRLQADFSVSLLLSFTCVFSMGHLFTPRPWLFSILFLVLQLDILMQARRTGRTRELLWLPLIYALWANVHIQFIDGLAVLGLAWVESLIESWGSKPSGDTRLRPTLLGGVGVGCLLATLANPFGWRIYQAAYELASQGGALYTISEMQAMPFRDLLDFLILLMALASAAALAWRRHFPIFEGGLLLFAAVLSFRSQRDMWVMAAVGAAILASNFRARRTAVPLPRLAVAVAVVAAGLASLVGFHLWHGSNAALQAQVEKDLPVRAVETIKARGYTGPLFNNYDWGGYLIWSQPMPVAIDGRAAFYGDKRIDRSMATWNAQPDWVSDTQLTSAGVVLAPVKAPLTQLLRLNTHFQLVYEDKLAAVFIARH